MLLAYYSHLEINMNMKSHTDMRTIIIQLPTYIFCHFQNPRWLPCRRPLRKIGKYAVAQKLSKLKTPFWCLAPCKEYNATIKIDFRYLFDLQIQHGQQSPAKRTDNLVNFS